MSKIRCGHWLKAKVLATEHDSPMVKTQLQDNTQEHIRRFWVNRSLIRKNPDPWHDVIIPGLDTRYTGTELPRAPYIYLEEEDEQGEPIVHEGDRPDDRISERDEINNDEA